MKGVFVRVRLTASRMAKAMPARTQHRSLHLAPVISADMRMAALARISQRMEAEANNSAGVEPLQPFFDRLTKAEKDGTAVHVLQYGDSHTASDDWPESMREVVQNRYGFGGPGFTMAGHPYKGYRRFDIQGENSAGWVTSGTPGHIDDHRDGLGGVSLTAYRAGETVSVTTSSDQIELYYLQQPGGGSFSIESDGAPISMVNSNGDLSTAFYPIQPFPGEHTYVVRTLSNQPVRLFGWVSQNGKGITWETLGINGAQASLLLTWDEVLWEQQIRRRDPALIVIAYGTNEALYALWTADEYRSDLLRLIQRFRRAVPDSALLLVGPPDCGGLRPFPHLEEVIQIQSEVARQTGVAFWNWQERMGGPNIRSIWVRAGLSQPDYTHFTGDGYRLLGRTLAEEIDTGYRRYLSQQPSVEAASEANR